MEVLNEKRLILIVEDNIATLDLLVKHLSGNGFETVTARSGRMALQRARRVHPDLILLDVMLPDLDGFDVCRQLKSDSCICDIPVVFMTVLSESEAILRGFEVGGADYIAKPFQPPEVIARVSAHVAPYRLQRALEAEIQRREASENELRRLYTALQRAKNNLEQKVEELTHALAEANAALNAELAQRQQQRLEKESLFEIIRRQSQQLNALTLSLAQMQQGQNYTLPQAMFQQIIHTLDDVADSLAMVRGTEGQDFHAVPSLRYVEIATEMLSRVKAYLVSVEDDLIQPIPNAEALRQALSERERQVLAMIAEGHSAEKIADFLMISPNTVYTYRRRIMEKLEIENTTDLLKLAVQLSAG
jgi:DNA-binding response OmpR family regulator/DNA-binding CsgD family transcriptional regulator